MIYELRHKDEIVAQVEIAADASRIRVKEVVSPGLLPICAQSDISNIENWWKRRAVPTSRSNIRKLLDENSISSPHQFLLQNLALSVTDCYWICPKGSNIEWGEVSFHKNDFKTDLQFSHALSDSGSFAGSTYNPSASLGGDLDKRWVRKRGKIFLVKGNMPGNSFQQSLNEVFASSIHKLQGFENHVEYKLVKLKSGSIGCISPCFTTDEIELVPAWEIFDKYGYAKTGSYIEQYVSHCAEEGVDKEECRKFLDYQFMIDFIMTNKDRHLSNFGLLRDSSTLECISPAPIFDSGNSMFYDGVAVVNYRSLLDVKIQSLYSTERKTMENVVDPCVVDLSRLPTSDDIRSFYEKDPALSAFAARIAECFGFKCAMAKEIQNGKPFSMICREIMSFYSGKSQQEKERLDLFSMKVLQKGPVLS